MEAAAVNDVAKHGRRKGVVKELKPLQVKMLQGVMGAAVLEMVSGEGRVGTDDWDTRVFNTFIGNGSSNGIKNDLLWPIGSTANRLYFLWETLGSKPQPTDRLRCAHWMGPLSGLSRDAISAANLSETVKGKLHTSSTLRRSIRQKMREAVKAVGLWKEYCDADGNLPAGKTEEDALMYVLKKYKDDGASEHADKDGGEGGNTTSDEDEASSKTFDWARYIKRHSTWYHIFLINGPFWREKFGCPESTDFRMVSLAQSKSKSKAKSELEGVKAMTEVGNHIDLVQTPSKGSGSIDVIDCELRILSDVSADAKYLLEHGNVGGSRDEYLEIIRENMVRKRALLASLDVAHPKKTRIDSSESDLDAPRSAIKSSCTSKQKPNKKGASSFATAVV